MFNDIKKAIHRTYVKSGAAFRRAVLTIVALALVIVLGAELFDNNGGSKLICNTFAQLDSTKYTWAVYMAAAFVTGVLGWYEWDPSDSLGSIDRNAAR